MSIRAVIGTGSPDLDKAIREALETRGSVVTATTDQEDQLKNIPVYTQANLVVWSHYMCWRDGDATEHLAATEEALHQFKANGIRSVLICTEKDWVLKWLGEGFTDFVYVEDGMIQTELVLQAIFEPKSVDQLRQEIGIIVPVTQPLQIVTPITAPAASDRARGKVNSKIIGLYSVHPGMGVSTFTSAVAVELAMRGYRTALIEWDMLHPTIGVSLGMTHPNRNMEQWLARSKEEGETLDLNAFLLNSTVWKGEVDKSNFASAVAALPDEFYLLTPSDLCRPWTVTTHPSPYQVAFLVEQLKSYGFQAVIFDIPSEITYPVTGACLKESDEVYVLLDGRAARTFQTTEMLGLLKEQMEDKFQFVLNRVPDRMVPAITQMLGKNQKVAARLPEDETLSSRSFDLLPSGGNEYQRSVEMFCDRLGYISQKANINVADDQSAPQEKPAGWRGVKRFLGIGG